VLFRGASLLNAAILALFIFNAGGVRLISNSIITVVIVVLLLFKIQINRAIDQRFFFRAIVIFSAVLAVNYLLSNAGFSPLNHIVLFSYIFSAAVLVAVYRSSLDNFALDLRLALMFFAGHAFLGFLLQFIFDPVNHFSALEARDIAMTFFYPKMDSFSFMHRNSGLFWEPGVLQLFMNILLFLSLFVHKNKPVAFFSAVIIISTLSTTGFAIMLIQAVYFFYLRLNKRSVVLLPVYLAIAALLAWLVAMNIGDKLENKSSTVRMFDLVVGFEMLKERPIVGVGLNSEHFVNEVGRIGGKFQNLFGISDDELEGKGLTNGVLYLLVTLGIPMSLLLLYLFYIQSALPHRMMFALILIFTGLSEPIVQTGFYFLFIMFGFSTMVGSKRKREKLYF
jgi:hypothetical protein